MVRFRTIEPKDPRLSKISRLVPDRWLDDHWPLSYRYGSGRWQYWRTSQLVRIHLLALLKALGSFNRVCEELHHNNDFRRFCRLPPRRKPPSPGTLTKWRADFGEAGWLAVHVRLLAVVAQLWPPSPAGIVLLDATDLPAAVRRTSKKKTSGLWASASHRSARRVDRAAAKAASPIIISAFTNTPSTA